MSTVLSLRSSQFSTITANTLNSGTLAGSTIIASTFIQTSTINSSTIYDNVLLSQNIYYSTLIGLSTATSTITLTTSTISLGQSTNTLYTALANGAVSTAGSWVTSLTGLVSTKTAAMSGNGLVQLVQTQVSTISSLLITTNSGQTWSTLSGTTGLPTAPSNQTFIALSTTYNAVAMSRTGQYQLATTFGGYPYLTSNYGATWSNMNPNMGSPYIYLPFDNSIADAMNNSVITSVGSPGYVTGKVGSSAINLVNTAGSASPSQYIRGTWTVPSTFTISLWFNVQQLNSTYQVIFSALGVGIEFFINPSNQLVGQIPSGTGTGQLNVNTSAISTNTWYSAMLVYQSSGTSSFYLNNALVGNFTANTGFGTWPVTNTFGLGTYDNSLNYAFNGYIDDVKIYNTVPPIYLPFETLPATNSIDVNNRTTLTVAGSVSLVSGIVGTNAINLTNTPAGTATQYIRGTWTPSTNFTWDFWFYTPSSGSGIQQNIMFTCIGSTGLYIDSSLNKLYWYVNGTNIPASNGYPVVVNTWYHITAIFQGGSTGYLYVNNALWASGTCPANAGTSTGYFTLSGTDAAGGTQAFNGYIDDLKIYNYAITPSAMVPMNYNNAVMSANGQYQLVTASGAGLYMSSNFGTTWSQISSVALNALWQGLAISATGQYMLTTATVLTLQTSPQQSGLSGNAGSTPTLQQWYQNGILWGSISSSIAGSTFQSWIAFNTLTPASATGSYSYASTANYSYGAYTGATSITITGTTTSPSPYTGEWIEIQSSTPVICYSYNFACGAAVNIPKNFYIVGSNDRTTWYPIHSAAGGATNPFTIDFSKATSTNIIVNQSGAQTMIAGATGTYTCTIYPPYTTRAYLYFRLIANTTYGTSASSNLEFTELYMQFTAGIFPQLTGLTGNTSSTTPVSTTWTQNGVTWISNSSSVATQNYQSWIAFNNKLDNNGTSSTYSWASAGTYNTSTGNYTGSVTTTVLGGVGSVSGEWIQLQSSVALILYSYNFADGGYSNIPQKYYIVGSNDGTNWYPIQYVQLSNNIYTQFYTPFMPNIIVNQSGSQTITGQLSATASCTTYSTTTNSYTYFRLIGTQTYGVYGNLEFVELALNFVGVQSYSTNYGSTWSNSATLSSTIATLAISGSGQYAIGSNGQTLYIVSNYLAGFSTNTYTIPTLPSINAIIVAAALSHTGQYMVIVTGGTTNNVYYSSDYGATFVAITLGSSAMTSCTMAYDGSYITVTNATTTYTLNNTQTGYSVAIGYQAGYQNQGQNAIAIGNQSGQQNQIANSVILNASGTNITAYNPGFYVSPVGSVMNTSYVSVMGYGADNQIVNSSGAIVILPNGNVGIGYTNPTSAIQINGQIAAPGKTFDMQHPLYPNTSRHLVHSSVEAPRCDLIYRGTAQLEAGVVAININKQCTFSSIGAMDDGTYESLCANPQYFLQNLTGFDRLLGTIQNATLTITCENVESTDTVSWLVVAERADPYIKEWNRTDENGFLVTQYNLNSLRR